MNNSIWKIPKSQIFLYEDDLHIWKSPLNIDVQRVQFLKSLLSTDETKRAERFYFDKDKEHFEVGRGILRVLLGNYLNINPKKIKFHYNQFGKPFITDQFKNSKIQFNLSHSKDMLVLVFCKTANVGIDIEFMRTDFDLLRLARQFFSKREVKELISTPSNLLREAFFNCWTRKEAFIKAKGKGLSIPLDKFDVSSAPGKPARLCYYNENPSEISDWFLYELNGIGENYISSVAIKGRPENMKYWEYDGKFELVQMYSSKYSENNSFIFN